jgi:hypothetical protein
MPRPRAARTWLSIRVDLIEGRGEHCWPRPGRILAAARSHTFAQLAVAIDDAFARWDRAHLHEFRLADGTRIGIPDDEWDDEKAIDGRRTTLTRLRPGEQFLYVFDFGDDWTHLCTVGDARPLEVLGVVPAAPRPYVGWGNIPDQYGQEWDGDDGESPKTRRPGARRPATAPALVGWPWRPLTNTTNLGRAPQNGLASPRTRPNDRSRPPDGRDQATATSVGRRTEKGDQGGRRPHHAQLDGPADEPCLVLSAVPRGSARDVGAVRARTSPLRVDRLRGRVGPITSARTDVRLP